MKFLFVPMVALSLAAPGMAFAQTANSTTGSASTPSASQQSTAMTAQKMKQDLQKAGFTDVNVVAEAFVVQAKTKDGNPVVMTIGPHGMSAFETVSGNSTGTSHGSTGSGMSSGTTGTSSGSTSTSK